MSTTTDRNYDFECTDFALSAKGVHLMRNGYPYQTIPYEQLHKATVKRGAETKNVLLSFLIGVALLSFSLLKSISLYRDFHNPTVDTAYMESILLPLFPALVGAYFLYAAFQKGPMLHLAGENGRQRLRLRDVRKQQRGKDLIRYLHEKLDYRFVQEHQF